MVFNSLEFAVFLAIVFPLYLVLPRRGQNLMLLAASYVFYGMWDWRFLGLLIASTAVDFLCGLAIDREQREAHRRRWLWLSVAVNLSFLGFFKYFDFFAESLQRLLASLGIDAGLSTLGIYLPVGISFYTFQSMSYTIDVYRRQLPATRHPLDFALYVAFFPQLVAGPILRASYFMAQVLSPRRVTAEGVSEGTWLIFFGLFKKVFIADNLAPIVERIYAAPGEFSGPHVIIGIYAFAWQIYCDFSGYSDIARGLGKIMGFDIRLNFNLPYFARDPTDFWNRWHISLSLWLRDYLFNPLGGNRRRTLRNLVITMGLGGLWHGAAWHFVAWGLFCGCVLVVYRLVQGERRVKAPSRRRLVTEMIINFNWFCLSLILFRAASLGDFGLAMRQIATDWAFTWPVIRDGLLVFAYALPLFVMELFMFRTGDHMAVWRLPGWARVLLYTAMYFAITLGGALYGPQFYYFQF